MFKVASYSNIMTMIAQDDHFKLFEYHPSVNRLLAIDFEKLKLIRRMRFLYEYLHSGHFKVYYLAVDGEFVGYCVVTPGGRRLPVSTKNDIVLGPYFVSPEHRGKGYAKVIVRMTIEHCTYNYQCAYDWIHDDNFASIKTSEACGFVQEGHRLNVVGIMRKLVLNDSGDNIIYKYIRK